MSAFVTDATTGQRSIWRVGAPLFPNAGAATVSGTAYFAYLGYMPSAITVKHVEFAFSGNGTGVQTAEVGLFSTSTGPDGTAKTFTKLVADGTLDSLTAGSPKIARNATAFNSGAGYSVAAGTHLWAGLRIALASGQPTVRWLLGDHSVGMVQSLAASGALTGAGPFGPASLPALTGNSCPDMWAKA